jgi:hypothetical protein
MKTEPLRIFLSYSHSDKEFAEKFRKQLCCLENEPRIATVFFDKQKLRMADDRNRWGKALREELEKCDILLALMSPDYNDSTRWAYKEFKLASDSGKAVIPIRYRACQFERTEVGRYNALPSCGSLLSKDTTEELQSKTVGEIELCIQKIFEHRNTSGNAGTTPEAVRQTLEFFCRETDFRARQVFELDKVLTKNLRDALRQRLKLADSESLEPALLKLAPLKLLEYLEDMVNPELVAINHRDPGWAKNCWEIAQICLPVCCDSADHVLFGIKLEPRLRESRVSASLESSLAFEMLAAWVDGRSCKVESASVEDRATANQFRGARAIQAPGLDVGTSQKALRQHLVASIAAKRGIVIENWSDLGKLASVLSGELLSQMDRENAHSYYIVFEEKARGASSRHDSFITWIVDNLKGLRVFVQDLPQARAGLDETICAAMVRTLHRAYQEETSSEKKP